jgi:hypothetical protein
MLGYLDWISFLGYDFQSYPYSQKISLNILSYPIISYHILSYPKISWGTNPQMITNLNATSTSLLGYINTNNTAISNLIHQLII